MCPRSAGSQMVRGGHTFQPRFGRLRLATQRLLLAKAFNLHENGLSVVVLALNSDLHHLED